jgi:hypothetical protein
MKKNDWEYLAKTMWNFAETNNGRMSPLIKELIIKLNNNLGVIIDELDELKSLARSDGYEATNTTSKVDFNGTGEF